MNGNARVTSSYQLIGYDTQAATGSGFFQQNGGTNTTSFLYIGKTSEYQLGAGTLRLYYDFICQGVFDGANGNGAMNCSDNAIIDFSQGSIINANHLSLTVGANSLVLLPKGFILLPALEATRPWASPMSPGLRFIYRKAPRSKAAEQSKIRSIAKEQLRRTFKTPRSFSMEELSLVVKVGSSG
jgi:hypothetical protein